MALFSSPNVCFRSWLVVAVVFGFLAPECLAKERDSTTACYPPCEKHEFCSHSGTRNSTCIQCLHVVDCYNTELSPAGVRQCISKCIEGNAPFVKAGERIYPSGEDLPEVRHGPVNTIAPLPDPKRVTRFRHEVPEALPIYVAPIPMPKPNATNFSNKTLADLLDQSHCNTSCGTFEFCDHAAKKPQCMPCSSMQQTCALTPGLTEAGMTACVTRCEKISNKAVSMHMQHGRGTRPSAPMMTSTNPFYGITSKGNQASLGSVQNTSPAPMQDALRLSMGSLMGFCRCESCEQVIGDLIDNLEDDFPGRTYQEGDVMAIINYRFCYGVRWVFRSACRYILSKYMDETVQLLMMEASEREVCETLRFCW